MATAPIKPDLPPPAGPDGAAAATPPAGTPLPPPGPPAVATGSALPSDAVGREVGGSVVALAVTSGTGGLAADVLPLPAVPFAFGAPLPPPPPPSSRTHTAPPRSMRLMDTDEAGAARCLAGAGGCAVAEAARSPSKPAAVPLVEGAGVGAAPIAAIIHGAAMGGSAGPAAGAPSPLTASPPAFAGAAPAAAAPAGPTAPPAPFPPPCSPTLADELLALGHLGARRLVSVLGGGTFGVALLAWDRPLARYVAIKVSRRPLVPFIAPGHDPVWDAAVREWEALRAATGSAGVPAALELGVVKLGGGMDGAGEKMGEHRAGGHDAFAASHAPPLPVVAHAYAVLELLGPDLWRGLRGVGEGGLERRAFFVQHAPAMLEAVEAVHAVGLIHRDIKLDNFCRPHATQAAVGAPAAVLIDFGGAVCAADLSTCRPGGPFYGTPCYASDALLRGEGPSPLDDVEALGYCFVEMWNGRLPWGPDFDALVAEPHYSPDVLECMADSRAADWEDLMADGGLPWWLQAWFQHAAEWRRAAAAAGAAPPPPAPQYAALRALLAVGVARAAAEEAMAVAEGGLGAAGGAVEAGGEEACAKGRGGAGPAAMEVEE